MGKSYLIDTDIIIDLFKAKYALNEKINEIGLRNCFVSEITIAELKYGALKSSNYEQQSKNIRKLKEKFGVIPISDVIDKYSQERLRLERLGKRLPDFDILIAVTAVVKDMILVTGNEKHHSRIEGIIIENWRKREFNEFIG